MYFQKGIKFGKISKFDLKFLKAAVSKENPFNPLCEYNRAQCAASFDPISIPSLYFNKSPSKTRKNQALMDSLDTSLKVEPGQG